VALLDVNFLAALGAVEVSGLLSLLSGMRGHGGFSFPPDGVAASTDGAEQVAAGLFAGAAASAQTRQCSCMPACRPHSSPHALQAVAQASSSARLMLAS